MAKKAAEKPIEKKRKAKAAMQKPKKEEKFDDDLFIDEDEDDDAVDEKSTANDINDHIDDAFEEASNADDLDDLDVDVDIDPKASKKTSKHSDEEASDDDQTEDSLQHELEASAAEESDEDENPDEDAEDKNKTPPVVLVPVSLRLDKSKIIEWFKKFNELDSYVIFTYAGSNYVELFGVDAPSRISVMTKVSNLESEGVRKEVSETGYIPMSNDKESLLRHMNVVTGNLIDLIFDGKNLTIRSGEESSSFSPSADQVTKVVAMRKLFNMKESDDVINALDVEYVNKMVFDKKFCDLYGRWDKYKREYIAFIIDDQKVMGRLVADMTELDKNTGAKINIEPTSITSSGQFQITFTATSMKPMNNVAADDEISIHYFANDFPYIVTTKSGATTMIIASTIVPQKSPEEDEF